jgi:hypothetical protein
MNIINTVKIGSHLLSPIVNGDYSGLSNSEGVKLDKWLRDYPQDQYTLDYRYNDFGELKVNFTECVVSGLLDDCATIDIYINSTFIKE